MDRNQMSNSCVPVNQPSTQGGSQSCSVVKSRTESECTNVPNFPCMIKADVVLAEPTIQVCVEADVELERPAIEIKRVKKDAVITQCKLVKACQGLDVSRYKLFIAGYIRKNIEYATANTSSESAVCGDIRHTTAHVPFHCCTPIEFNGEACVMPEQGFRESYQSPFLNEAGEGPRFDKTQFDEIVCYGEQPFCELVCAEFHEIDFAPPSFTTPIQGIDDEVRFRRLREKIVMELTVKVLQKQQIPLWQGGNGYNSNCPQ